MLFPGTELGKILIWLYRPQGSKFGELMNNEVRKGSGMSAKGDLKVEGGEDRCREMIEGGQ